MRVEKLNNSLNLVCFKNESKRVNKLFDRCPQGTLKEQIVWAYEYPIQ